MCDLISRSALIEETNNLLKSPYANFEEPSDYDVDYVVVEMEEYRTNFDCSICKHNKTEGQVCTKDCTDALVDGLLEIVKNGWGR